MEILQFPDKDGHFRSDDGSKQDGSDALTPNGVTSGSVCWGIWGSVACAEELFSYPNYALKLAAAQAASQSSPIFISLIAT
jgi:hypothetical protein